MAQILVNALSLRPGGGLQVIMGLLASFSDEHRYTIIWSDPRSHDFLKQNLSHRNNVAFECPIGVVSNIRTFLWQMTQLQRYAKRVDADLVLSVNHHFPMGDTPQIIYHLSMLRFDRPARRIWQSGEIQDRLRDWRAGKAIMNAEANVLESQFLSELAAEKYGEIRNAHTIYIGLKDSVLDEFQQLRNPNAPSSRDILAITSPQPHKDNPTLIRMMAELEKATPSVDWKLQIAGGKPGALDDLKRLAEELGVAKSIEFLGFASHERLQEIAGSSLCLVSPSLKESFSMVALEAMSWGCPAIVADTAAMPESVGNAGLLAEPGNAKDFAEAVLRLHDDEEFRRRTILRGLDHASENTWSKAAGKFERLFDTCIGNC